MFTLKSEKTIDRQVRQISYLSQHIHDVVHIQGTNSVVPDALSRIEIAETSTDLPPMKQWATDQAADSQLQQLISGTATSSLRLQPRGSRDGVIYADYSTGNARMFVPSVLRRRVINALHGLAHGGNRATLRLINLYYDVFNAHL